MSVILVGYRGSGKTSVARCLAQQLNWKMIDTDQQIVQAVDETIREIFATQGEAAFRDLESAQLRIACQTPRAIISLGGGAVLREENRAAIRDSRFACVYLACAVEELARRIHADPATATDRPPLTHLGGSAGEIASLLKVREPLYREVAGHIIDVTTLTVEAVCKQIQEWL